MKLALNVSPAVAHDTAWFSALEATAKMYRSVTERLIIEISESAAIANLEEMVVFVAAVKQLGCQVALDGFGTGYSSFRHLRRLGVDMVKIDASFVEVITSRPDDNYFVRTLVDLARNFGIATVGEGVTDEATAQVLAGAGVTYMQGYLFGGPELTWPEREGIRIDRG